MEEDNDSESDQDAPPPKTGEFVGAGRRFLAVKLSDHSSLRSSSKRALSQLLSEANILVEDIQDQSLDPSQQKPPSSANESGSPPSVFRTLLELFGQSPTVSSAQVIKHAALKIPADVVPGKLDAREFILSLLYFMSLDYPADHSSSNYPKLPLIAPLQATPDLEKRVYEKAYDWKLEPTSEFAKKLQKLERDFLHSPISFDAPWLPRSLFVPVGSAPHSEIQTLLSKGKVPTSMTKPVQKRAKKSVKSEKPVPVLERSTSDAHPDDASTNAPPS